MATALTNHRALSFAPRPFSYHSQYRANKSLKLASLPIRQKPSLVLSRRPLVAAVKVAETNPTTINGDEEMNLQDLPDMKQIIKSYKEAIWAGDLQSISELETIICAIQTSKEQTSSKLTSTITEIASKKDRFLRLNAEFDNFRKQMEKDRKRFSSDVKLDVVESLLPIIDSFEKVKMDLVPETEKESKIGTSYQGIYKQFVETLRSLGVSVIETAGKPFDPSVHEAIGREESEEFKAGIVLQEVKRGFLLKDRVLRPASVKVSNGSGLSKTQPVLEESVEEADVASDSVDKSTDE
ncbi:hypothetical protein LUZ60_004220 [Juncus effusus]|nr:hypothetical protein LUZ60_004220 [Juncus effusus]